MKPSHQSRSRDRTTQINKTESFGRSLCAPEMSGLTRAEITAAVRLAERKSGEESMLGYLPVLTEPRRLLSRPPCFPYFVKHFREGRVKTDWGKSNEQKKVCYDGKKLSKRVFFVLFCSSQNDATVRQTNKKKVEIETTINLKSGHIKNCWMKANKLS